MIYLANAFSLQMIQDDESLVWVKNVSQAWTKELISKWEWISVIGHEDTASIVSSMLGVHVPANRETTTIGQNDMVIIAQVIGGRLPEGCKTLPDNFRIVWKSVVKLPAKIKNLI